MAVVRRKPRRDSALRLLKDVVAVNKRYGRPAGRTAKRLLRAYGRAKK